MSSLITAPTPGTAQVPVQRAAQSIDALDRFIRSTWSYERLKSNRPVRDFVDGITAATAGGIAGAAVVLGRNALSDWPAWLLAVATLAILLRTRLPEPMLIAGAGVVGLAIRAAAK